MKNYSYVGLAIISIFFLASVDASQPKLIDSKTAFCRTITSLEKRRALIDRLSEYQVDPQTNGGIFSSGLCWWKSRLTRSAMYLSFYSPNSPRPTNKEAAAILKKLAYTSEVVEIPGFSSFAEFTTEYRDIAERTLEDWQKRDAVRGAMRTLNPLRPTFHRRDKNLFLNVAIFFHMLEDYGAVPFALLQMKGIAAHSWLIKKVTPIYGTNFLNLKYVAAYEILAMDPDLGLVKSTVRPGDEAISRYESVGKDVDPEMDRRFNDYISNAYGETPIYGDFLIDLDRISKTVKTFCPGYPAPNLYPHYEDWGTYR